MENVESTCQCACGARDFQVRLKRDEQVGLLTCAAGHHSLLLDSRDYWADVLQDGRPKITRCRCGSNMFRVKLRYEFRQGGDVRTVHVNPICAVCGRGRTPTEIEIDYSPTDQLVAKPLDPIEQPWRQPERRQITAFWKPTDAERFASYLTQSLHARVFAQQIPYQFVEVTLADIDFYPELRYDLLFTNVDGVIAPLGREPEKSTPFLRLNGPIHMHYSFPKTPQSAGNIRLLHYIRYSDEVVREHRLVQQPNQFLTFGREAFDWLKGNFVSLRGKNTADNPEEYMEYMRLKQGGA